MSEDNKQNFFVENKDVLLPITQMVSSFILQWWQLRQAKKEAKRISIAMCGKCPETVCKLQGKRAGRVDFERCYDEVLTSQMPNSFGATESPHK